MQMFAIINPRSVRMIAAYSLDAKVITVAY